MTVKMNTASSGSVTLTPADTASNITLTFPAQTGTLVSADTSGNVSVSNNINLGADTTISTSAANYPSDIPPKYNVDIDTPYDIKRFQFTGYGAIGLGNTSSVSYGNAGQILISGGEYGGAQWVDLFPYIPSYGAAGSYVFAYASQKVTEGTSYSGSILRPAGGTSGLSYYPDDWSSWSYTAGGSALSGTWRCMGRANGQTYGLTLFLRLY